MDGDGEEEGVKFRVTVVSNQGIKGWRIMLPSFPEVAGVGDGVPGSRPRPSPGRAWWMRGGPGVLGVQCSEANVPFLPFLCPEKEPNIQRQEPRGGSCHVWDPD